MPLYSTVQVHRGDIRQLGLHPAGQCDRQDFLPQNSGRGPEHHQVGASSPLHHHHHHHYQERQQYRSEGSSLSHPAHLQPLAVGRGEQRAARHPGVLSYCHSVMVCYMVMYHDVIMCYIVRVRTQTTSLPCCLSQSQTDSLITGKVEVSDERSQISRGRHQPSTYPFH